MKNKDFIIVLPIAVSLILLALGIFIIVSINNYEVEPTISPEFTEENIISSNVENSNATEVESEEFSSILLVNYDNPLPTDYESNLVTVDKKYLCGYLNQLNNDVMPFVTQMLECAWAEDVDLYIWSPYRSYDSQATLYNNEVAKQMKIGLSREEAEIKAATVVARPGTSEHHTGLAMDFNSVEDTFENSVAFNWLSNHAENYGFVLRYPKNKQDITGVIYEPWHWRYVGVKHAKEMNKLGMCLEEYVEYVNTNLES